MSEQETVPSAKRLAAPRIARALDFASDWGVLAYAVWTLIAWAGMATRAPVSVLVPIWLGAALAAAAWPALRPSASPPADRPRRRLQLTGARARRMLVIGLGGTLVFAIVAGAAHERAWTLAWAGAALAVATAIALGRLTSAEDERPDGGPSWVAHAVVLLAGLGLAALSLFVNRSSTDDVFYVGRATATDQLNRIPVKDVIYTREAVGPTSGAGLPLDSFSALEGAVGHFVGLHGASVAYYVVPPLMTFFATWALWRLLRSWAARNLVLCFAVGCTFWLLSAQSLLTPGGYFLGRMWQGKVIFVAWLIPTIYVLLTRWLRKRDVATAVLLVAAGIGSIGMTSSAAIAAPLVFATAAVSLVVQRDWWRIAVPLAAAAVPFLVGLVATRIYPLAPMLGGAIKSPAWYFHEVFGTGVVAALGAVGLCAVPWLARSGAAARLATGVSILTVVLLTPLLLPTLSEAVGLTGALRRTLWLAPLPALVGLLASAPLGPVLRLASGSLWLRRAAIAAPAALVAALLIGFGDAVWTRANGASLIASRPTWKVEQAPLATARAILARYDGRGSILTNRKVMLMIPLLTVEPKAVNARRWYAVLLPGPRRPIRQRVLLTNFVEGRTDPPLPDVARALSALDVGIVCPRDTEPNVIAQLESLDGYSERFRTRGHVCYGAD